MLFTTGIRKDGARAFSMPGYQPEIQGMRALSVLAVIWAHARIPGLPGGFTGVDVFFVISGFLITRLLLAEMARTGRIDLLAFWARRARRLLPNAFAALIGTVLLALFLFPGYSPEKLAREVMFAALEFANFHFANGAVDYFQSEGAASPVLHFWSLSVEEQFYMAWPPVLLGLGLYFRQRFLRAALLLLGAIWCVSFAASLYLTYAEQPFAYFGTGTRCWQLATGALLAAGWQGVERLPASVRAALAWLGLTAILAGMVILGEAARYPGAWALLPTLGAAALIAGFGVANPSGLLRRGLSASVMQWVGARSYSWYLWHWPLLALPRITYADSPYIELIAVPASLVIACTAYSWIEMPFRTARILAGPPLATLLASATALGVVIGIGYLHMPALFVKDAELASRIALTEALNKDVPPSYRDNCHLNYREIEQPDCFYGDITAARNVVLFGDSHAAQWFAGLQSASKQSGWKLLSRTKSACPSIEFSVLSREGTRYTPCWEWRERTMMALTDSDRADLVILSNYVSGYTNRVYDPTSGQRLPPAEANEAIKIGFRKTINRLLAAGVDVAIIRDAPQADKQFDVCFIVNKRNCARPREQALPPRDVEDMIAREFAGRVKVFDFADVICAGAECPLMRDGVMVYRDNHHLTASFSTTLAPQMVQLLDTFARKRGLAEGTRPGVAEAGTHLRSSPARGSAPVQ